MRSGGQRLHTAGRVGVLRQASAVRVVRELVLATARRAPQKSDSRAELFQRGGRRREQATRAPPDPCYRPSFLQALPVSPHSIKMTITAAADNARTQTRTN